MVQADPPPPTASLTYSPADGIPYMAFAPSEVCAGFEFYGPSGDKQTGTLDCAADLTNLLPGNIKSGVTIGGVVGQYPSVTFNLTGATSTVDLVAASLDARMKSATVFEWFDSTGARYTGAGDADLSQAANLAYDVTIFGMTGRASNFPIQDPWDLRAGKVVGAVTGKLKVNCRNGINLSSQDISLPLAATIDHTTDRLTIPNHGMASNSPVRIEYTSQPGGGFSWSNDLVARVVDANTIELAWPASPNSAINITSNGTDVVVYRYNDGTRNIWDTIDDWNGTPSPANLPTGWSVANNYCGNVDPNTPSDDDVWLDVTVAGSSSGCVDQPTNCTMKDRISGLKWSKVASTSANWQTAIETCHALTHNGQPAGSWRLPTQKEMMEAYVHGIASVARPNWITLESMRSTFWSATGLAFDVNRAQYQNFANGNYDGWNKANLGRVVCIM